MTFLSLAILLWNIRFLLLKPTLQPMRNAQLRSNALGKCMATAQFTARQLNRSVRMWTNTPSSPTAESTVAQHTSWEEDVRRYATSDLCQQLWSCTVVLLSGLKFDSAALCIQISTAIGSVQSINMVCGRRLENFLQRLLEEIQAGPLNSDILLQSDFVLGLATAPPTEDSTMQFPQFARTTTSGRGAITSTCGDVIEGDGSGVPTAQEDPWPRVLSLLQEVQRAQMAYQSPTFAAPAPTLRATRKQSAGSSTGKERMSISNLI